MSDYNQKYNKDDVFIRSMIVCFLAELNKDLYIYNRMDDNSVQKNHIPCLYSITGGERFLKDEFYYDALEQGKAYGDYEKVPRCMVSLSGISINQAEQTNKYNRTKIVRESNGILRTLYLNVEWIPVILNFECKVICSNNIELLKISELVITRIYKNPNYFKVDFGMFNVDGCFLPATDYNWELPQEFGLNDKKEFSTSFSIQMKSFLPAFEHGLQMCEIDEMLAKVPAESKGIIEYRPDEYGVFGMRPGGVLEEIAVSEYAHTIDEPTLKSNTHKSPMRVKSLDDLKKKDEVESLVDRRIVTP